MANEKPVRSHKTFLNPYTFIELEKGCDRHLDYHANRKEGKLTGWIEVSMVNLTPLFIPNSTSRSVFRTENMTPGISSLDFFSYTDLEGQHNPQCPEPIIPGSEIRGVIRSVHEVVTNSCMSAIDDEKLLYKRTNTPGKPGRLIKKDNRWFIQPCDRVGVAFKKCSGDPKSPLKNIENFTEGQEVYIHRNGHYKKMDRYKKKEMPLFPIADCIESTAFQGAEKGFFHRGEYFPKRHHESVFVPNQNDEFEIDEAAVKNLKANLELYADNTVNISSQHEGYSNDRNLRHGEGALVYYSKHCSTRGTSIYLCPAAIGREVFHNRIKDLIGDYIPCEKLNQLCPTCALFGIAGKDEAAASRIRFADARYTGSVLTDQLFENPIILPELASPKPSATEFYLQRPVDADLWNYDYAIRWQRNNDKVSPPSSDIKTYTPKIMGRKFYWHQTTSKVNGVDIAKASKRNVMVRPLKPGASFKSRIYFDRLTEVELKILLWTITLGNDSANAHKMGMGKPVGLGSVQFSIDKVVTRSLQRSPDCIDYTIKEIRIDFDALPSDCNCKERPSIMQLLEVTQLPEHRENQGLTIHYPQNEHSEKVYEWFMSNKKEHGTGTSPVVSQNLKYGITPLYQYTQSNSTKPQSASYRKTNNYISDRKNPSTPVQRTSPPQNQTKTDPSFGVIKFYQKKTSDYGYGFIKPDNQSEDVFFDTHSLDNPDQAPVTGNKVSYTDSFNSKNKKKMAKHVKIL
jgi:CRISPR-associated protein (TIGR03986 family)